MKSTSAISIGRQRLSLIEPMQALQTILTNLEREPHQVAFRQFDDAFAIYARLPDVSDEDGKPLAVPFAVIDSGLG